MEHRKLSLLHSCIFTENDGVDPAPANILPRVRCAVFSFVLFRRGGGRVRMWHYGDHPDLKHSSRIWGFVN